jgi:Transposase DDE domain/Transposase domain (DUF772)
MRIALAKPLFAWEELEDSPSLATLGELLRTLPDGKLLASLRQARGKGRDDYPVHVLWGVVVLSIACRHPDMEACLAELRRNAGLCRLIGIETTAQIPNGWNMSRFLAVLGEEPHRTLLKEVFDHLITTLGQTVSVLGQHTAGDSTQLSGRAADAATAAQEVDSGLPQPSGGRKEYTDDAGHVMHAIEWFGYKLHLLVDVKHEVAIAYEITDTKAGDGETLPTLLHEAQGNLPPERIETVAYDKAADTNDVHAVLSAAQMKPVIQNRALWKEEHERMLPGHDGHSNVVYDEAGTVYCYDRVSEPMVRHPMAYIGYEPDRQAIKYRCPAKHEGWECPMSDVCNAGKTYGKTVRVPRAVDLRRFPALPRATKKFEHLYKGRTSVERVNARLKIFWGIDDGNIKGSRRFHAWVGAVMVVHAAFATLLASAPRYEGTLGKMRLSPIAQALRDGVESRKQSVIQEGVDAARPVTSAPLVVR